MRVVVLFDAADCEYTVEEDESRDAFDARFITPAIAAATTLVHFHHAAPLLRRLLLPLPYAYYDISPDITPRLRFHTTRFSFTVTMLLMAITSLLAFFR